ncbi:MAG: hypothetical protein LBL95_06740 [Deltaproteobacteria bacterium]|jgi:hypothetical protein|nr:hypothetical protein [Deltaproteobacteria bacterium]
MFFIYNYQLSVFGDYKAIVPEIDLITRLTKNYTDIHLLPSSFPLYFVNNQLKNGPYEAPQVIQRIQIFDDAQNWNVPILPDRIDANYAPVEAAPFEELGKVSKTGTSLMRHAIETCEARYNKAMASVTLKFATDEDKLTRFYKSITNALEYEEANDLVGWQVISNRQKRIGICGGKKKFLANLIFIVSRQTDELTSKYYLLLYLEVNSVINHLDQSLYPQELDEFNDKARDEITKMKTKIEEKWNDVE